MNIIVHDYIVDYVRGLININYKLSNADYFLQFASIFAKPEELEKRISFICTVDYFLSTNEVGDIAVTSLSYTANDQVVLVGNEIEEGKYNTLVLDCVIKVFGIKPQGV